MFRILTLFLICFSLFSSAAFSRPDIIRPRAPDESGNIQINCESINLENVRFYFNGQKLNEINSPVKYPPGNYRLEINLGLNEVNIDNIVILEGETTELDLYLLDLRLMGGKELSNENISFSKEPKDVSVSMAYGSLFLLPKGEYEINLDSRGSPKVSFKMDAPKEINYEPYFVLFEYEKKNYPNPSPHNTGLSLGSAGLKKLRLSGYTQFESDFKEERLNKLYYFTRENSYAYFGNKLGDFYPGRVFKFSRIEVSDVLLPDGTERYGQYSITPVGDNEALSIPFYLYRNGKFEITQKDTFYTGTGIDVLPGKYKVSISYRYQGMRTLTYDIEV